ncbi:MAG: SLC13 family permease [Verrucomicrobiales bacterium]|nr:SLC13 family permease [Verrucomicrobiales bacterium]|tara:strand:- start:4296 stop:6119 length:1824 start_codon:yes stop_codon:yes gene_type:complete
MTAEQYIIIALIIATFGMFAWNRWRYDVVAATALFALAIADVILEKATGKPSNLLEEPSKALDGFGHPAVMTVAAVLIISRALRNSGVVDLIARQVSRFAGNQTLHIFSLCVVAAVLSAFMNNVGALALMLPVALKSAAEQNRSPGLLLMPLAFASILGGMVTMIGTPPNIIISSLRAELVEGAQPFRLFEFAPVGGLVALGGVAFVVLVGWRLIPKGGLKKPGTDALFAINEYITEVRIPNECKFVGKTIEEVEGEVGERMTIFGFIRKDGKVVSPNPTSLVQADNTYLVKADPVELRAVLDEYDLRLPKDMRRRIDELQAEDTTFMEVVVPANSPLEGRDRAYLRRRTSNSIVLMAIARQGKPIRKRLGKARFRVGDVLLLQGSATNLEEFITRLNLMVLQSREVQVGTFSRIGASLLIFGGAITMGMMGLLPTVLAFWGAVVIYLFSGILPLRDLYREIDWPIIVLLGAMIPVSKALQDTECTDLIAVAVADLSGGIPEWVLVAVVMALTMCLSDVINNAATALIMAPIGVGIALNSGVNPDPFLMAVAVGASCAFLTPIGHQCNALILGPGGYKFGDYWRMGLPLEIIIVGMGTPLILHFWPL